MSTFRQQCPSCSRTLELPQTAIGKAAKCPACDATFSAGPRSPAPESPALESVSVVENSDPLQSPLPDASEPPPQVNPYAPTASRAPAAEVGPIQIVERSFDEVFSPTLPIFGERWMPLILAFLLVIAIWIVGGIVMVIGIGVAGSLTAGVGVLLVLLLWIPTMVLLSAYTSVGMARSAIAVARDSPSPLSELLPPIPVVVRFIIGGFIIGIAPAIGIALLAALIGVSAASGADDAVAAGLSIVGIGVATLGAMVAYWLLWSWMFVASDGRTSAIGAIKVAFEITMRNKLTSLLIVIIATVLSTAGSAACYVGILVTQPLTNLMFAVAYLLMTNQPISDPRARRLGVDVPPPSAPTF